MKKKILKLCAGVALVLGFTGCKNSDVVDTSQTTTDPTETVDPTETTTPKPDGSTSETIITPTDTTTPSEEPSTDEGNKELGSGTIVERGQIENLVVDNKYEGAKATWSRSANTDYNVYYKEKSSTTYIKVDSSLVRETEANQMRVDILGLKGKTEYDIRITPVKNNNESLASSAVAKVETGLFDRSGYAHFNYTKGVGAYNDDGSLKENAIVIYVTDENKDDILSSTPELSEYSFNIPGADWGGKEARGIGWYLNNAQYSKAEKDSSGNVIINKSSNTYSPDGSSLGFIKANEAHPICIRFIGTVTSPEGLTAYNSVKEGGTVKDNGHMARMKNLKNITIEGVGDDAIIDGWGFHFMCSDSSVGGESFEARNLTFKDYPEDALGMEGVQDGSIITAPVRNCWVHHNTFLPGYCADPAESDKAEGDGSCDFKRGRYFTMSYNYYENCHKTNLVGSSDSSLQYDISFHHNVWYQCGSRIPLLRNANIHFYNNYIFGDIRTADLSYVTSLRADCYMYSEYNYYDGCKNVYEKKDGFAKAFGNTYVSCVKERGATEATSRTELVANNCSYNGVDLSSFDTNPDVFYYDSSKNRSDCYLTDSVTAREECIKFAGSAYRTVGNNTSLKINSLAANEKTPTNNVLLTDSGYTAQFPTAKGDSEIGNILFSNVTGISSGTIKFKSQGITFKLDITCKVKLAMSGSADSYGIGYLVGSDGRVYLDDSGEVILDAGTYFITSVKKDGETTVSSLIFEAVDTEELSQKRINDAKEAIALIPSDVLYDSETGQIIINALAYTKILTAEELTQVDKTKLDNAYNTYTQKGILYVTRLINEIGTVSQNSGESITKAKAAYEELIDFDSSLVVTNKTTLDEAIASYEGFAVEGCINLINSIGTVTLSSEEIINLANAAYKALSTEQKALVTNYEALTNAIERLNSLKEMARVTALYNNVDTTSLESLEELVVAYNALSNSEKTEINLNMDTVNVNYTVKLIDSIGEVTLASKGVIEQSTAQYNALSDELKAQVTNYSTLQEAITALNALSSQSVECTFAGKAPSSDFFTIVRPGKEVNYKEKLSVTYNGVTYTTGLKIESGIEITFTTASNMSLTIVGNKPGVDIEINGVSYTFDVDGVVTIELEAGNHIIEKGGSVEVVYIGLTPSN